MIELRQQLDKERSVRMMLEEQVRQCPLPAGRGAAGAENGFCGLFCPGAFRLAGIYGRTCFVPVLGMENSQTGPYLPEPPFAWGRGESVIVWNRGLGYRSVTAHVFSI